MTTHPKITKARTLLVQGQPFFGALSVRLHPIENRSIKTLGTDGKSLYYNPDFIDGLPLTQVMGALAHEVLHVSNRHHLRRGGRDAKRWNIACDHAINPIVLKAGFELPEGALADPAFDGMSAEQIYGRLPPGGDDGDDDAGGDAGDGDDPGGCGGIMDAPGDQSAADADAEVMIATVQAANIAAAGQLPGFLKDMVEAIKRGEIDWRNELRRFCNAAAKDDYNWKRPDRRAMGRGVILPSLKSERMGEIVVAIDTSGSVHPYLDRFLAEMSGIAEDMRPERVHLVYCDTRVQQTAEYEREDLPIRPEKIWGGGTLFSPVFQWVEEQGIEPACLVYLTDLEGDSPADPGYPTLWVSVCEHEPPFGEALYITETA